ncbi:threonylcarbamoyladenosine tRNA methylthiotransferase MtaB [Malonomonas rubra DSM 5091]|uniref:Threonylcarbamoyladenosine tRNA methylthiotransferase MtaB n=1 Tax=Malonomonas rubra DSM 5091 TaxID=1122189 RepID=A0A1M6B3Y5_MALRU|nr:tRNA (N(6)-L-threonylcarbamoyladenosine(37)-C(2))-methylthiotransferase MtaB [Malonomonas rubra]SHI43454.1 threonylcarbamoyladenosine tRNA methylthiotransferase MtaB [Malonomonas rubra DSM 5091]
MSQTVSIVTLGCKTNQFESAAMSEQLLKCGYRQIDFDDGADLVIVNTCTVTAATDSQSRNLIRRARRINPICRIVVTGCYAQVDPETLAELPGVALVIGNEEKRDFLERLADLDTDHIQVSVSDIRKVDSAEILPLSSFEQRSRAFVQIQNGCDAFCSYCIIPYARGRSRSVSVADVIKQVEALSDSGYPEIVLTGIHIGNYGQDLHPKIDLLYLLQQIEKAGFGGRLRLGSIEPTELPSQLLDYIAASDWLCPHYHIPLQAGNDVILKQMNRHYTTAFFRQLLESIRQRQPYAAIGLDIITGFPGETRQQFLSTCEYLTDLPFSHLHVFPYSRRPGTPAAKMKDQLPGNIIKERAAELRQIGEDKLKEYAEQFVDKELQVVIEGGKDKGFKKGLSQNYLQVRVISENLQQGQCCRVKIERAEQGVLYASTL